MTSLYARYKLIPFIILPTSVTPLSMAIYKSDIQLPLRQERNGRGGAKTPAPFSGTPRVVHFVVFIDLVSFCESPTSLRAARACFTESYSL